MSDKAQAQALDRLVSKLRDHARPRMLECTLPILAVHDDGHPFAHGSGVLLRIADAPFLLSCAHVLKKAREPDATLLLPGGAGTPLIPLVAVDLGWTTDEKVDLGFALLPDSIASRVPPGISFLRLSDLILDRTPRPGVYSALGYPVQTTERDAGTSHINSVPLSFTSFLASSRLDSHIEGTTLALTLDPNAIGDPEGNLARMPALEGISGGGIWRLAAMDTSPPPHWSVKDVKLIGIEHGYVRDRALKGSHIAELIDLIRGEFPALRSCIDIYR